MVSMTTPITPQAVAEQQSDLYRRYILHRYPQATIVVRTRYTGERTARQSVTMLDASGTSTSDAQLDGVPFDDHPDWIAYFESINASVGSVAEVTIRTDRPARIRLELQGSAC